MKQFMDKDFILNTKTAKKLYHKYAESLPIIDYHCHIVADEIAEDRKFDNIAQVWLGADHYKWRAMRVFGIDEKYITGDSSDYEKWMAFSKALPKMFGSPLYHWAHLELRKYFGINKPLNEDTADEIWNICNQKLKTMSARKMVEMSNVDTICTTNDPTEDLTAHGIIAKDTSFKTKVFPAFRPDPAVAIDKPAFVPYIEKLSACVGREIKTFADLKAALEERIDYFKEFGCRAADHGLDYVPFGIANEKELDKIFKTALSGKSITTAEADAFKTAVIALCSKKYTELGWVMEVHFGVYRNTNDNMFKVLGADAGFDTAGHHDDSAALAKLLNHLNNQNSLPKTVLFPIDPGKNVMVETIAGSFGQSGVRGRVQQGAAWWFNDTKCGMEAQLKAFSDLSVLGCFIGMLTDSRSFLSYTRHEYFRRILCNYVGDMVENGEYPNDEKQLKSLIEDICYYNVKNYFGWN